MARGNVAAAVCSASASNFIGIFVTPLLVSTLIVRGGARAGASAGCGAASSSNCWCPSWRARCSSLVRRWVSHNRHAANVDQGSILLVVYTAFSAAVLQGLWKQIPLPVLGGLW